MCTYDTHKQKAAHNNNTVIFCGNWGGV